MGKTPTALRTELREKYTAEIIRLFSEAGEDVLRTGSNEIAFPVCDSEGNDQFIQIVIKVPTGSREDKEPFDGYGKAQEYKINQKNKAEKAKIDAEKKAKKIARDQKAREEKAKAKEE